MPGYTDPKQIPYPLPTEPPNGAAQMRALADKVDDLLVLVDGAVAAGDAALDTRLDAAEAAITSLQTVTGTQRVKYGYTTVTVAAANDPGEATLTHNAGWVPNHILLTGRSSTGRALVLTVDNSTATATTVKVRCFEVDLSGTDKWLVKPVADGGQVSLYWTVRR